MAGILDFLTGNSAAASPWGALYQNADPHFNFGWRGFTPFNDPAKLSVAPPVAEANQPSPLDAAQWPAGPVGAPKSFGGGASPFGFAGPGSMTGIAPAMMAAPMDPQPPAAAPIAPQIAAAPATDLSSVNRGRAPDDFVPVGDYQMPAFRGGMPAEPAAAPAAPVAAPMAAPAPARAPFSLGGGGAPGAGAGPGFGDRISAAAQSMQGSDGLIPGLFNGISGLMTGRRADATGRAEEKVLTAQTATAQALISKGATPAEVSGAIGNPSLMKALVDQYYGKDKWSVVQTGEVDGVKTYRQQNAVDGTLRDIPGAAAGAAAPGGADDFVTGPGGQRIPYPPGVDRKEFRKKITDANADAATGKVTEGQGKAGKFSTIASHAERIFKGLEGQGQNVWGRLTDNIPVGSAYFQSPEYQSYKSAKEAFIGAHLRDVSGAAIGSPEFVRAEKTFFPQPGEGPEVVRQKGQLRASLIETMKREAGPGFKEPAAAAPSGKTSAGISWSVQ